VLLIVGFLVPSPLGKMAKIIRIPRAELGNIDDGFFDQRRVINSSASCAPNKPQTSLELKSRKKDQGEHP
jgi:hypothetical protein